MPHHQHLQSRGAEAAPREDAPSTCKTQRQHILDLLMAAEGAEVPLADIMVCAAQYNRCIYNLRKGGYKIVNRSETRNGVKHSWYRLESSPAEPMPGTRKKAVAAEPAAPSRSETTRMLHSSSPAQETLSLFPEMAEPQVSPQRPVWRDPELGGVKNAGVKHYGVKHG
jgi:hypothetical protein